MTSGAPRWGAAAGGRRTWTRTRRSSGAGCAARSGRRWRRPRTRWCRRCRAPPRSRRARTTARPGPAGAGRPGTSPSAGGGWCRGRWRRPRPGRRPPRGAPSRARSRSGRRRAAGRGGNAGYRSERGVVTVKLWQAMARISHRISAVAESATLAIDAKAKALKAAGEDVIGFGAGEPDFPTPAHIVDAAVEACRDPRNHHYTPAGGLPELRGRRRRQDRRGLRLAGSTPARCWSPTAASRRSSKTFATLLDPGDEVLLPAPYWTTYPESIRLAGGVPVVVPTTWAVGFRVTVEQLEAARTARTKACCSCRPPTRPAPSTRPTRSRPSGGGRSSTAIWVVDRRDLRAPRLRRRPVHLDARAGARAGRHLRGHQRRGQDLRHDRLAGGMDDRPRRRHHGRHQPAVPRHVERVQRGPAGRTGRGGRRPGRGGGDAGHLRPAPADDRRRCSTTSPASAAPSRRGRSTPFPASKGCSAGRSGAGTASTTLELADLVLDEAKVAFVPGEAFGAPGYARFSYALGDDALVEGITRPGRSSPGADRRWPGSW